VKLRWLVTFEEVPDPFQTPRAGGKSRKIREKTATLQFLPTGFEDIERNWRDVPEVEDD